MSERLTASVQGPTSGQRSLHCAPERFRARQRIETIDRRRRILKRGSIGEDKGNRLAGLDRELADRSEILAMEPDRGAQDNTLRAGNRVDRPVIEPVDPWHGRPVVEAHHQLSLKIHSPRSTDHDPHKMRAVGRRHEIDYRRRAGLSLEFGFEDQGARTIAPSRAERWILWGDKPTPIIGCSRAGRQSRQPNQTRPAQPVDRAVAADQSRRLAVAYQRVVFDSKCHCCSLAETSFLLASVYSKIKCKDTLVIAGSLQNLAMPQCASGIVVTGAPMFLHSGA